MIGVETQAAILGAFVGAMIAFTLVLIRDWTKSIIDKKNSHHEGLIRLEIELVRIITVLGNIAYATSKIGESLKNSSMYWTRAPKLEFDYKPIEVIQSLSLRKDILDVAINFATLSDEILVMFKVYDLFVNQTEGNPKLSKQQLEAIASSSKELSDKIMDIITSHYVALLAKTQLLISKDDNAVLKLRRVLIGETKLNEEDITGRIIYLVEDMKERIGKSEDKDTYIGGLFSITSR